MQINGFNKITLLDYPTHLAATIFTSGCDFRCPFCHNSSLVLTPASQPIILESDLLAILDKRRNILEGVCITGGEPTLQKDLPIFIRKVKDLGLKIKLDTNGNHPDVLKQLLNENLLNYIAMDIKNSKEQYHLSVGLDTFDIKQIDTSIDLIMSCGIDYEFRTTIVKEHHTAKDLISIGQWIKGAKAYYLQSFKDSPDVIEKGLTSYSKPELEEFAHLLLPYVNFVSIRGVD